MLQRACNALGTIIEAMIDILKDFIYQCLVMYIDDIIIFFRMYKKHIRDWKRALQQLEEQKFYLKESKYQFFTGKLEILVPILT